MFDLLRPLTKWSMVASFLAFFVAANAALLYVVSGCLTSVSCIGTGGLATMLLAMQAWLALFLPGNFFPCINCMMISWVMRRAYDFSVKMMDVTAKTS